MGEIKPFLAQTYLMGYLKGTVKTANNVVALDCKYEWLE